MVPRLPKHVIGLYSASTSNGATTATALFDTKGHDFIRVKVTLGTSNASSSSGNPSTLKLVQSDTSNFTDASNITNYVGDTDFTIPNQYTSTSNIVGPFAVLDVDLRGKKRYIGCQVVPVTTVVIGPIEAELYRSREIPNTAAEVGADVYVDGS
jgi:hypothetical protein